MRIPTELIVELARDARGALRAHVVDAAGHRGDDILKGRSIRFRNSAQVEVYRRIERKYGAHFAITWIGEEK